MEDYTFDLAEFDPAESAFAACRMGAVGAMGAAAGANLVGTRLLREFCGGLAIGAGCRAAQSVASDLSLAFVNVSLALLLLGVIVPWWYKGEVRKP